MRRSDFLKKIGLATTLFGFAPLSYSGTTDMRSDLPPILFDSKGNPITKVSAWRKQRAIIRKRWLDYLGALKPNPNIPVLKVLKEDRPEDLIRQFVTYEGEPGLIVQGYLIKPAGITKALPGVVAMHSTSDTNMEYIAGVKDGKIVPFGYRLAKQGFVVFCPQCFLMHDKGDFTAEEVANALR